MSYKIGKFKCSDCGTPVYRPETKHCIKCCGKYKPKRVCTKDQLARIKEYKRVYYQQNKIRIDKRNKEYQTKYPEKIQHQRLKYHLRHKVGLEFEDYQKLLIAQNKKCAICKYVEPDNATSTSKLYVDHDHNNGQIRGLLCMHCNAAIGHFKEDLTILRNAVSYMEKMTQP